MEIKTVGNELIFRCKGPFATCEVRRSGSEGAMDFIHQQNTEKVIQGEFSLKNLIILLSAPIYGSIEMYLENDLPFVVRYSVASLGNQTMFSTIAQSLKILINLY